MDDGRKERLARIEMRLSQVTAKLDSHGAEIESLRILAEAWVAAIERQNEGINRLVGQLDEPLGRQGRIALGISQLAAPSHDLEARIARFCCGPFTEATGHSGRSVR